MQQDIIIFTWIFFRVVDTWIQSTQLYIVRTNGLTVRSLPSKQLTRVRLPVGAFLSFSPFFTTRTGYKFDRDQFPPNKIIIFILSFSSYIFLKTSFSDYSYVFSLMYYQTSNLLRSKYTKILAKNHILDIKISFWTLYLIQSQPIINIWH